ncbi:hypothetical protein Vretifemale_15345, partial [Volvox reticuliferus]
GIIFDLASLLLLKLGVDDPLGAAPMHGGCGAYGVLFTGLLAKKDYVMQSYTARTSYPYGLFYGGGGRLLACQVIGVLTVAGWTLGFMFPFFWILKRFKLLRVPPEDELQGLDISSHCSRAYYMDQVQDPSRMPQLVTWCNGATDSIAYRNKAGGAIGDAVMRPELMSSPLPQHTQQTTIATTTSTTSTSAWATSPGAFVLGDKSGRFGSKRHYQVQPLGTTANSTPQWNVRFGKERNLQEDAVESPGVATDLTQVPSRPMESQRSGSRNLDVQQGQKMQGQVKAFSMRGSPAADEEGVSTGKLKPQAVAVLATDNSNNGRTAEVAAGAAAAGVDQSPSAAPAGRILAGSRSSRSVVAPLGSGVLGAFEDGEDISVHQLIA